MKKFLITLICFLPLFSCNSFLDVEPQDSVTFTNYFKNEAEVEALYTNILVAERMVLATVEPSVHELMGLYCDDIYMTDSKVQENIAVKFKSMDPSTFLNSGLSVWMSWKSYYDVIYLANMMIDNEFRFENITQERKDFWLAQAWFTKGLMYFYIARNWGDAPIVPNSEYQQPLGKSPAKEVLAEAIRCASKALILPKYDEPGMVNANGKTLSSRQYASRATVYTLLANIYAWMGGLYGESEYWQLAEEYASEVIENRAGNYQLEPMSTFCINVLGDVRKSSEVIFAIEINAIDRNYYTETQQWNFFPGQLMVTYPVTSDDRVNDVVDNFAPSGSLKARIKSRTVQLLYVDVKDLRRQEFWYELGQEKNNGEDPYAYLYKWRKGIFSVNQDADRPYLGVEGNKVVWRLADLLLLRAECRARLGLSTAVNDLNAVRNRAGLADYSGSKDLREEIFRERERELFGEGQRYYDAVRNGYLNEISHEVGSLSATDIKNGALYLPVSEKAFSSNALMRQNIYWSWKK